MNTEKTKGFVSPFRSIRRIGDPFILYDDATGRYYMYCTGGHYQCWSSDTMETWTEHGDSYLVTEKSFGTVNYWAPEVYKVGDTFYMVYSAARMLGAVKRHSIGIASSKSPTGPFTDLYGHPLFAPDYSVIDASLLFDDDGKVYLYYSRDCSENYVDGKRTSQVWGVELAPDLSGTVGEPVLLATPVSPWELKSGDVVWNEGPCVFKRGGVYYLLFTANYYASVDYCVGYATADAPLGTFIKAAENPILVGDGVYTSGTGHCNITRSPDGSEMYMVYHSHADVTNTTNPVADRTPCVDKMVFLSDGRMLVNGPSVAKQPFLSGVNGLYKKCSGVTVSSTCEILAGDVQVLTDEVIFSDAAYRFHCDGAICLHYDVPTRIESLWIYGAKDASLSPKNVYAVAAGEKTEVKTFSEELLLAPVVFTFSAEVSEVTLYFESKNADGTAALSEIITVEEK